MSEIVLEPMIPVTVESTWLPDLRNPYVEIPGVRVTARLASQYPVFFTHLAMFICNSAKKQGYSRAIIERAKRFVPRLPGLGYHDVAHIERALDQLAEDYERQLARKDLSDSKRRNLPNDFTAAISEALVARYLLKSGRQASELVSDGHFRIGDKARSSSNVDIVWHRIGRSRLDLYECKHGPQRLLNPWTTKDHPGNQVNWKNSQLCLMLSVRDALTAVKWSVYLCCVTLRQRNAVEDALALLGCPPEMTVFAQEDFGTAFPPAI